MDHQGRGAAVVGHGQLHIKAGRRRGIALQTVRRGRRHQTQVHQGVAINGPAAQLPGAAVTGAARFLVKGRQVAVGIVEHHAQVPEVGGRQDHAPIPLGQGQGRAAIGDGPPGAVVVIVGGDGPDQAPGSPAEDQEAGPRQFVRVNP